MRAPILRVAVLLAVLGPPACTPASRTDRPDLYPEEAAAVISRGLVAFAQGPGRIFLSWRLLPGDPDPPAFGIYRREADADAPYERIAETRGTSYLDEAVEPDRRYAYAVSPGPDAPPASPATEVTVSADDRHHDAIVVDLGEEYKQARITTGDLDCDGELEFVVGYSDSKHIDPYEKAWTPSEDTVKVAAFRRTGERLWRLDLGWGIEAGGVYSPVVVWDLDADGCAEVLLKTNASGDRLDHESDRLTVLDGRTGRVLDETGWPSAAGLGGDYNNLSRNFLAIAHLDGKEPTIIAARGLYKTQRITAFDRQLRQRWERFVGLDHYWPEVLSERLEKLSRRRNKLEWLWLRLTGAGEPDLGHGSHSLPIADVNGDGKEEVLWGDHCLGEHGDDLWVVERTPYHGHPDIVFAADVQPETPGLETFYCREGWGKESDEIGMLLVDSEGKTLWAHWGYTHIDGGWVAKIDADGPGLQSFGFDVKLKEWSQEGAELVDKTTFLWDSQGRLLDQPPASWIYSFPVDWEGDGVDEICLPSGELQRYRGSSVAQLPGCLWGGDLFGDHREEVVAAPGGRRIYVFFNTEPLSSPPRLTRLANRRYRNDLSRTAMQFNVVPTEGTFSLR